MCLAFLGKDRLALLICPHVLTLSYFLIVVTEAWIKVLDWMILVVGECQELGFGIELASELSRLRFRCNK